jgi:hypothetical protein
MQLIFYVTYLPDQILAELIEEGGETVCSWTHKLINSAWNKEDCFSSAGSLLMNVPMHKKSDKIDCSNYWGIGQCVAAVLGLNTNLGDLQRDLMGVKSHPTK